MTETPTRAGSGGRTGGAGVPVAGSPADGAAAGGAPGPAGLPAGGRSAVESLRGAGSAAGRTVARALHAVLDWWRRSLQVRVGATTVVVAGVMVLVIGLFLVDKVSGGILKSKRDAAINQAKIGLPAAQAVLSDVDAGVIAQVIDAGQSITATLTAGGTSAGLFSIAIGSVSDNVSRPPANATIPSALREAVEAGNLVVEYAPVHPTSNSTALVPGLIVGEPVKAQTGLFELYYLFPLTAEQQTIQLVQRTVLLSGLALVIVVLAIALLVTRQVVRPVRVAARTAGQLAAGDLAQRIEVHGIDDLAKLGESFNDMAASLQRQIKRLEDLSRLQRRFTSDVSHELRTPLTTVRMAAELLYAARDEFDEGLSRSAELLRDELDRFEALLGDLLEISRYDAGVANLDSEPADIRTVVAEVVEADRVLADRHGSDVVVHQPSQPVMVDMDTRRVERILRNLLNNALDHGEGRAVVITVGHDQDAVAVTVRDHGVGLRPGEAGLVFNRFWRGDPSRSRLTGGTGLGLAISLEDARLHDGWLQAWGARGRGAQFRLTLPRRAGHTLVHSPLPLDPDEHEEDDE